MSAAPKKPIKKRTAAQKAQTKGSLVGAHLARKAQLMEQRGDTANAELLRRSSNELRALNNLAPSDEEATKLARGLFVSLGFSPLEQLIRIAMNPPDDLASKDYVALLGRLAEYQAPKAKAIDMGALQEKDSGVTINLVSFHDVKKDDLKVKEKRPAADYAEFGGAKDPSAPATPTQKE